MYTVSIWRNWRLAIKPCGLLWATEDTGWRVNVTGYTKDGTCYPVDSVDVATEAQAQAQARKFLRTLDGSVMADY